MFVIEERPSDKMVADGWSRNSDGGGFAHREPAEDGNGTEVVWKKGLRLFEMKELCAKAPLPYVAHFRRASSGGALDTLCHPFPVDLSAPQTLEGRTKGYVLFHNGDWKEWSHWGFTAALNPNTPALPPGPWSDTRMISWLCAITGINFMDLINQKGVAFGPDDYEIYCGGDGWKKIDGVWCSNDYFCNSSNNDNRMFLICRERTCSENQGLINGYCNKHREVKQIAGTAEGANHDNKKKEVICMECHALLGAGLKHEATCSKSPGTIICGNCHMHITMGAGHSDGCSVISKITCRECNQKIKVPQDHLVSCTVYKKLSAGGRSDETVNGSGGSRPSDPFHVVYMAVKLWEEKKLSKNDLKKVKERMGYQHWPTEKIKELAQKKLLALKDPRYEVVTH